MPQSDVTAAGQVCLNMSAGTRRGEQSLRDCGTNNYPLRGSKMTLWEGGVRGVSFIHHGNPDAIPAGVRGGVWGGMAHGTDWYASVLALAGVSAVDIQAHTGPLPPDGMDILPALLANATSPRRELVHNIDERSAHSLHQVRETPSRPRRWANFSVL